MVDAREAVTSVLWAGLVSAHGTETVTYHFEDGTTASVDMVVGFNQTTNEYDDGTVSSEKQWDFLCQRSDLASLPFLGERIEWVSESRSYMVTASPANDRHYDFSDPYEQILRIHTVQISG